MNRELLEEKLAELPLYIYDFLDPKELEFSSRIRWICENECPMYGRSWACPPGVGTVDHCQGKCLSYENCLLISTIVEVADITNIDETLATRPEHEAVTNQVRDLMRELAKHGIACDGHVAHQITQREYDYYDRIYYMDGSNARWLRRLLKDTSKCFPLLDHDVADPWYTGDFTATWNDIVEGCNAIMEEFA